MVRPQSFSVFTKEDLPDVLWDWSQQETRTPARKKKESIISSCSLGSCHQELCFVKSVVPWGLA